MRSLRTALVAGTTIGMLVVLFASGMLLYVLIRSGLRDQFDRSLIDSARLLGSTMEQGRRKIDEEFHNYDKRDFESADHPAYLQIWLADGSDFYRSSSLGEASLKQIAGSLESPELRWVRLPDGRAGRQVGMTFQPRMDLKKKKEGETAEPQIWPARTVTLVLAHDTAATDAMLARLKGLLLSLGLVTIAVSSGVLWLVILRSLRPVNQLAGHISQLNEEDLSTRIDVRDAPQELTPVVDQLNGLLRRLDAAFQRERSLSSAVAHELRTPLAGLRSTMDVALSRPRHSSQYREALDDCLQITTQMQDLVESLLSLARLEAGQVESKPERVFPNELVRATWKPLSDLAVARGLRVDWALGPPVPVITDPSLLGFVVRNLLDNAVAHADEGGSIKIETVRGEERADIRIRNSGSLLPQEEAEHAFERFWRGDAARSEAGSHCGLGLSLVQKIVALLGGSVQVQSRAGGDFEITVSIPSNNGLDPE